MKGPLGELRRFIDEHLPGTAERDELERIYEGLLEPIPMFLFCPSCGEQHIDEPDEATGWSNPPHRSHLCRGCGEIWRPADVPTTGAASIQTRGAADTWISPLVLTEEMKR